MKTIALFALTLFLSVALYGDELSSLSRILVETLESQQEDMPLQEQLVRAVQDLTSDKNYNKIVEYCLHNRSTTETMVLKTLLDESLVELKKLRDSHMRNHYPKYFIAPFVLAFLFAKYRSYGMVQFTIWQFSWMGALCGWIEQKMYEAYRTDLLIERSEHLLAIINDKQPNG